MPIKIAILDDHQQEIDGLKSQIKSHGKFEVVAESTNGLKMMDELRRINVDLLLTDIAMPIIDGYEISMRIKKEFPKIKVIALSMKGDGAMIDKMIERADVKGYLLKSANQKELFEAIYAVTDDDTYFSREVIEELHTYSKMKRASQKTNLTSRELEIVQCIVNNLSSKQIADKLFISERTVETHRKNIFKKSGVHSVVGLIDYVKKRNLKFQEEI